MTSNPLHWTCSVCRRGVSKQGQHSYTRVKRTDGSGWDHARCTEHSAPLQYSPSDVDQLLAQRRIATGLQTA